MNHFNYSDVINLFEKYKENFSSLFSEGYWGQPPFAPKLNKNNL